MRAPGRLALGWLLLGALLATAAWVLLRRYEDDGGAGGQPSAQALALEALEGRTEPEMLEGPTLTGLPTAPRSAGSRPPESEEDPLPADPEPVPSQGFVVEGRVLRLDGWVALTGCEVALFETRSCDMRLLASTRSDAQGLYRLRCSAVASEALSYRVATCPEGLPSAVEVLTPQPGDRLRMDLLVLGGESVRGRVVDPDGRPVPHLRFMVVGSREEAPARQLAERSMSAASSWLARAQSAAVMTTTDADGRFSVLVREPGNLRPQPLDDLLRLECKEGTRVPPHGASAEVEIVAKPAFRLWLHVRGPGGEPVESYSLQLGIDGRPAVTFTNLSGAKPWVVWTNAWPPGPGPFELTVAAWSRVHEPQRWQARIDLDRREVEHELVLRPLDPERLGVLVVENGLASAPGRAAAFGVTLVEPLELGGEARYALGSSPHGAPLRAQLRAGRVRLRAHAWDPAHDTLWVEEEIDVPGGGEVVWKPVFPVHGSLRLRAVCPAESVRSLSLKLQRRGAKGAVHVTVLEDEPVLSLPTGTWIAQPLGDGWGGPVEVEVRAGEEALVTFRR